MQTKLRHRLFEGVENILGGGGGGVKILYDILAPSMAFGSVKIKAF